MHSRFVKALAVSVLSVLCVGSSLAGADTVPNYVVPPANGMSATPPQVRPRMDAKWAIAAQTQLTNLMRGSGLTIAMSIQSTTHPSGKNPSLQSFNVLNLGDHMMVQINVLWYGGMLGNAYQTSVNWEVSPDGYMGAKVVGDTAMVAIEKPNLQAMDDYFRQSVYPVFYSNMEAVASTWR